MIRNDLHNFMTSTTAAQRNYGTWTYEAVRPMPVPSSWTPRQHVVGDCSKGCQYLCRWAGAPDPMGNNWDVWGNSTTIWVHLPHAPLSEAEVGDMVTFGFFSGEHHAAMIYETGADPLIWNFGGQGQPIIDNLSTEIRFHRGMTVTLCKLPVPDPPPTPEDKLRAKTGFYSWLAWRLGEGPWKKYGKQNRRVRPDVPKIIPLGWWVRNARFLANRRKGNKPSR